MNNLSLVSRLKGNFYALIYLHRYRPDRGGEVLCPLATEQVEIIDLDDGVKVNYPKLGAALKKIVGLDAKEE